MRRFETLTGLVQSESCIPLRSSSGWFCNLFGMLNGFSDSNDIPFACSSVMQLGVQSYRWTSLTWRREDKYNDNNGGPHHDNKNVPRA